jgi:hypothetical protein
VFDVGVAIGSGGKGVDPGGRLFCASAFKSATVRDKRIFLIARCDSFVALS